MMEKPIFGLKVAYRLYKCEVCGHERGEQTNHTDRIFPYCEGCSWKGVKGSNGKFYRADIHKNRPAVYIGPEVKPEEFNSYWAGSRT